MNLEPIRFDRNPPEGYECSNPFGDMSGEYFKAEDVRERMAGLVGELESHRVAIEDVMELVKQARMSHGDCTSGKRYGGLPKACTACMAKIKLDELADAWKGRAVRLA